MLWCQSYWALKKFHIFQFFRRIQEPELKFWKQQKILQNFVKIKNIQGGTKWHPEYNILALGSFLVSIKCALEINVISLNYLQKKIVAYLVESITVTTTKLHFFMGITVGYGLIKKRAFPAFQKYIICHIYHKK